MSLNRQFKPPTFVGNTSVVNKENPTLPLKRQGSPLNVPQNKKKRTKRYIILWRKQTQKKNKTWDGDGKLILDLDTDSSIGKSDDGITLGRVHNSSRVIHKGVFRCGNYECEIDCEDTDDVGTSTTPNSSTSSTQASITTYKPPVLTKPTIRSTPESRPSSVNTPNLKPASISSPTLNKYTPAQKFNPLMSRKTPKKEDPLYDTTSEDALVLPRPPNFAQKESKFKDVVVDPLLASGLREHQRKGIIFLYECVMGYRDFEGYGALLADEMGLGKTLQTISLIWTLVRQNPIIGEPPVTRKVLICCPVTLIGNWKREFKKWLGMNKISVLAINGSSTNDKQSVLGFATTKVYQVMIIGYEKMLTLANELEQVPFDMVVCDEGHRLKSGSNKVLKTLERLKIKRRIILSGTPIQNDLTEFFNVINFINPNVLGDLKTFQKDFMKPILRAREASCSNPRVLKMGEAKSKELINLTNLFLLRRTNDEISDYLPPRSDYALFAPPTKLQVKLFKSMAQTSQFRKILDSNSMNDSLGLITTFRKICNSPSLLKNDGLFLELCDRKSDSDEGFRNELGNRIRSAKINLLIKILTEIAKTDEKVVLISNFTQTLDILEKVVNSLNLTFSRLDGSTPAKDRDRIVSQFNTSSFAKNAVFLLSAKSGGCGLNLIGASRLILFDNDWNPSIDLQAMGRIHRDGQKRPVFIYRLLTAGCIDEKIFQRQLIKMNLSDKFLDGAKNSDEDFFNNIDLKDLFTINEDTNCNTHYLMGCQCSGDGQELLNLDDSESDDGDDAPKSAIVKQPSFSSALDFSQNYDDKNELKRRQQIKRCLRDYRHLDTLNCQETNDSVINTILKEQKKEDPVVSFSFMKYDRY